MQKRYSEADGHGCRALKKKRNFKEKDLRWQSLETRHREETKHGLVRKKRGETVEKQDGKESCHHHGTRHPSRKKE